MINLLTLILGKKYQHDNELNNCYTRAKELLENLISRKILIESNKKSIYPYKIYYKINNQKKILNGFFILLKIREKLKIFCLKSTKLFVYGNSYQELTQTSSIVRSYKKPEPYKGKGILYETEKIILKEGKKI